jgi:hypothetical protein
MEKQQEFLRLPTDQKRVNARVVIYVAPGEKDELQRMAALAGVTMSELCRRAVRCYLGYEE